MVTNTMPGKVEKYRAMLKSGQEKAWRSKKSNGELKKDR